MKQNPKWVEFLREQFPLGTRIRLMEMKDPYAPVPPGTEGTLEHIDDACQFHMRWDNGRTLALVPGIDRFTVIPQPLQTLKLFMPLTVKTYESTNTATWITTLSSLTIERFSLMRILFVPLF